MKKTNRLSKLYDESTIYSIFEVYQNFNEKKYRKYLRAIRTMEEYEGWGFKIIHYQSADYTCAFLYMDENKRIKIYYFSWTTEYTVNYH